MLYKCTPATCVFLCSQDNEDDELRPPWSLWNFVPGGVSMQFDPFRPGLNAFRRRHGNISLSLHMDARDMTFEVTLEHSLQQAINSSWLAC